MTTTNERIQFPLAKESPAMAFEFEFCINGRWLSLYRVRGRTESTQYSLYWNDTGENLQHAMNHLEVFAALSDLLDPERQG